jgi:PAS domain S-box-containing protein
MDSSSQNGIPGEGLHLGSCVYDLEHRSQVWSADLYRILGVPAAAAPLSPADLGTMVAPDDRQRLERAVADLLAAQTSREAEVRILRPDGDERFVRICGWRVGGCRDQLFVAVEDITRHRRTEGQLRASEERYRALVAAVPDLIFRISAEGVFVDYHAEQGEGLLLPPEAFLGRPVDEVLPPHLAALFREESRQVLATGEMRQFEYPLEVQGEGRHYETRMVGSGQGELLAIVRDITRRKATEEGIVAILRGSRGFGLEFFRTLATSLASVLQMKYVFIGRVAPDNLQEIETLAFAVDGRLADNFRYLLKGTPCEEVVGKSLCIYPDAVADSFPEDLGLVKMGVRGYAGVPLFASSGRSLGLLVAMDDQPLQKTDLMEHLLSIFAAHAASELERLGAQEALARSEQNYRKLFDEAIDGIVLTDRETGIIAHCNTAFENLTGWPRVQLVGRFHTLIYPPADSCDGDGPHAGGDYLLHVREDMLETCIQTQSGRIVDVEMKGSLIDLEGRSVIQAFFRDITDRKRAERRMRRINQELERRVSERTAELEAANRELESFCYSVSHDLRAPLRGINGFSRMLMEEYGGQIAPEASAYLTRIASSCERMGRLIDDLLTLSRISRWEMRRGVIDLTRLGRDIADDLNRTAPDRRVEWRIAEGLGCYGDHTLIRLVLENLLANAWKYTSRRPEAVIELGPCAAGGKDCFFVRDNGAGFDMAYADKLFTPFERLHGAEFEGTGVGLATVQRIVERHGGTVRGEGTVDGGAVFRFTLPSPPERADG